MSKISEAGKPVEICILVNKKALVVAATLRSRLFNTLEWAKNGGTGKLKIYLFLLYIFYLSLIRFYF